MPSLSARIENAPTLFASIKVDVLQARQLPRGLRPPSAYVALHADPNDIPLAKSEPAARSTAPKFNFNADLSLPHAPGTWPVLHVVLRDAADASLGTATVAICAPLTECWSPLRVTTGITRADVLLRIRWPRCPCRALPPIPVAPSDDTTSSEIRIVDERTGRLFRAGSLFVEVTASGIPVSVAQPLLTVRTADQILRAGETPDSKERWRRKCALNETGTTEDPGLLMMPSLTPEENIDSNGAVREVDEAPKSRINKQSVKDNAVVALNALTRLRPTRSTVRSAVYASVSTPKLLKRRTAPRDQPLLKDDTNGTTAATTAPSVLQTLLAPRVRRAVDFGVFSFAVLAGVEPTRLSITVTDSDSRLPDAIASVFEAELSLDGSTNMAWCACESGTPGTKVMVWVRITRQYAKAAVPCKIVTSRFQELLETIDEDATHFKERFPHAENLTYLLVGGLFTNHYPMYFSKNIDYLQEILRIPRVQCVPINTESGLAANAKVIAASVSKTCTRRKSVVLIGHSKGGLDILEALTHHVEILPFIYGIISYQAPFSGTFAIDTLTRSNFAVKAISAALEKMWRGERGSLLDMSYTARGKQLEVFTSPDGLESTSRMWYRDIPIVALASCAPFELHSIRSAADIAGIASMSVVAQHITKKTGFMCDGLVVPADSMVPFSDIVYLHDMMHTEPALYVPGTKYPPGQLTACALTLLFEKVERTKMKAK